MLSPPKLSFCINQNHKEKHCVDLVNILAMIDNGKFVNKIQICLRSLLWQMAILWLEMFCKLMLEKFLILVHALIKCNWI